MAEFISGIANDAEFLQSLLAIAVTVSLLIFFSRRREELRHRAILQKAAYESYEKFFLEFGKVLRNNKVSDESKRSLSSILFAMSDDNFGKKFVKMLHEEFDRGRASRANSPSRFAKEVANLSIEDRETFDSLTNAMRLGITSLVLEHGYDSECVSLEITRSYDGSYLYNIMNFLDSKFAKVGDQTSEGVGRQTVHA